MRHVSHLPLLALVLLAGCQIYPKTPNPDYTIRVMKDQGGTATAIPPNCANWVTDTTDPFDNQPTPQLGCSSARNLALMVEKPNDLIDPAQTGEGRSVVQVGAMRRYDASQTRGLIWTGTDPNQISVSTSSATASGISGVDAVLGGGGTTSSASTSSPTAPSTPSSP